MRAQATFDQVDMASFLNLIGQPRWIMGRAQGQVQLEGTGETAAELVRQSHGKTSLTVKNGELIGIGLNDVLKRIEKRPLATSLDWRGGRTAFDVAHVSLNIGSGIGEITEGRLSAPTLQTTLQGHVSLVDRALDIKALVDPTTPSTALSPMIVFDVSGAWDAVRISPDAKSLIQRSGAAKPLFGPEHPVQAGPLPMATAQ
jgi:AsmA protein